MSAVARALARAARAVAPVSVTRPFTPSLTSLRVAVVPTVRALQRAHYSAEAVATETEKVHGPVTRREFQAETNKLLDIVAKSLYSEQEVFVRELVSNASDALEKLRHVQQTGAAIADHDVPFEIRVTTDEAAKTITIQDTGIGMNEEELVSHLGTIARSGSKAFIEKLGEGGGVKENIIGQFGVGFYSAFMVASKVTVFSRSAIDGSKGYMWTSDGTGSYEIAEAEGVARGTKIIMHLKPESDKFSHKKEVETILKRYSNFVGHPILLNGERVNTLDPLWMLDPKTISEEQHADFYRFIANAFDDPKFRLHFSTDAPLQIRSLFYVPSTHMEKFGLGRSDPGVSLYSRKVLIQPKMKGLLPEWMRFVKGVVDSPDIPLNLSRELLQDSRLIRKLGDVLSARIVRFLADQAKADPDKYNEFAAEFGNFLKEGVCTDEANRDGIAKLLRFESSATEPGKTTSLAEYAGRMHAAQKDLFYLCVPSRAVAEGSPYNEAFKRKGVEVLYLYEPIDDFAMANIRQFDGKRLVSIESGSFDLSGINDKEGAETPSAADALGDAEAKAFGEWLKETLGQDKVSEVKVSARLVSSPIIVTDHESASYRRILKMVDNTRAGTLPPQVLEFNASHPVVTGLNKARTGNPEFARVIAEQLYDNALVTAGLLDDPRSMLGRLNEIMRRALEVPATNSPSA